MKKLAIGCGIVVLLVGVCAVGVTYYLYRQVSSTLSQYAELATVPDLERSVTNRSPFTPPATEELTDSQIEKLVQVQAAVRQRLGAQIADFEAKYKALAEKEQAAATDAPAILKAYADLARMWMDAKRSQVEALNAAGLSLEEYRWIRSQSYRALGMAYVDLDIGKLVDEAKRGITSESAGRLSGAVSPEGPESNRIRLEKLRKTLEQNIALASFGL